MKSSFCIDLQRFMLIPTKFPLSLAVGSVGAGLTALDVSTINRKEDFTKVKSSF